jgi:hypothetical protein
MALTIVKLHDPPGDDRSEGVYDVTFDSSYPSGGYALTPASFGRRSLHFVGVEPKVGTRIIVFDGAQGDNGNLRIFTAIGTEAANASDQSAISARVHVIGPA